MRYILALVTALLLNAGANLLMKIGMKSVEAAGGLFKDGLLGGAKAIATSATLLVGLLFFALNAVFYMYALQSKALKISIAYPIMVGGGFALIVVIARLHPALAERLTLGQGVGVILVLIGIFLIVSRTESA